MKTPVLWILTADHQHARMFTTEGGGGRLHPVEGFAQETHLPASHEAGSHPPDTGFASRGGPRHGYPARTTPHAQAGLAFLDRVAAAVVDAWEHRAFERLVLAAPPKALGELRQTRAITNPTLFNHFRADLGSLVFDEFMSGRAENA